MTKQTGTFKKGTNAGTAKCEACGKTVQKARIASWITYTTGTCEPCYDEMGDQNSVADGNMTCVEFKERYGYHSDYCDCGPVGVLAAVLALSGLAAASVSSQS